MDLNDISRFLDSGAVMSLDRSNAVVGYGRSIWKDYGELEADKPAFYFPNFFLEKDKSWLQFTCNEDISFKNLSNLLSEHGNTSISQIPLKWQNPCKNHFFRIYQNLLSLFTERKLLKAVPYMFCKTESKMSLNQLRNALNKCICYVQSYPCYLYGFWNRDEGLLGATPELLFDLENSLLTTMALAGTCSKSENLELFMTDFKMLREHQLVIEGIKQSLQHFGNVSIGNTTPLQLSRLNHLMTPLAVRFSRNMLFEDIVSCLHPTPALGAIPKEEGWRWLKSYDQLIKRDRFGAPVGLIDFSKTQWKCYVAIRNVQWDNSFMKIGAGCGIIKESQYESEWNEIQLKLDTTRELLGL